MLVDDDKAWGLPALGELGSELHELEQARGGGHARSGAPLKRFAGLIGAPVVTAIAILVVLTLESGPAGALSVINQAPSAAARSTSVGFASAISETTGGHKLLGFSQHGQIDFARGEYRTSLSTAQANATLEWRTVGGVVYFAANQQRPRDSRGGHWVAVRLSPGQRANLASAPESDALTDPLAVLRLLANTRAPVLRVEATALDGVAVTRYRLSTNLAAMLRASSSGGGHAAYARVGAILDVWLDRQGRPRRVEETLRGRGGIELHTAIAFSGYGEPVRIEAPAGVTPEPTLAGVPRLLTGTPSRVFERLVARADAGRR
jgi:hypothetical protein